MSHSLQDQLVSLGLAIAGTVLYAYVQLLRTLVYRRARGQGARPLEDLADTLQWVDHRAGRASRIKRLGIGYALLAMVALVAAMGSGVNVMQLASLLVALSGPAAGLFLRQAAP